MSIDSMQIAPRFTVTAWKRLWERTDLGENGRWARAIVVFRKRIFSRFIEPADILIDAYTKDSSKKVGFAVLALDFIVIETLQAFIEGKLSRNDSSGLCKRFLTTAEEFKDEIKTHGFAVCLYGAYRCGISHQGQTDGDFRVRADGNMIQRRGIGPKYDITINRTKFHEGVKKAFNRYCNKLRRPHETDLRAHFLKKMNAICGITS
jgi:hypothetical protein